MGVVRTGTSLTLIGLTIACTSLAYAGDTSHAQDKVFETNVTNDLTISSGEPEISVDPIDPKNLAIIEFALGSAKVPAYSLNPVLDHKSPGQWFVANMHIGRLMLSKNGGTTWTARAAPAFDPATHLGGGDPMIAYGPDGTLYVADCTGHPPAKAGPLILERDALRDVNMWIVASTDGGQTFTFPQPITTPRDRPWLKVDQSTGTVYTASTGWYNPITKVYNDPTAQGAVMDRWLTAWRPHLTGHSAARRIGGPDFSGAGGSTLTAANGVLAATFVLGLPQPGGKGRGEPVPIPVSLQGLVKDGTNTCSLQSPCLFFETSSDEGEHWTRHYVPMPDGLGGFFSYVAADPGQLGRYAIGFLNRDATSIRVLVTDDSGATWSKPATVIQMPRSGASKESPATSIIERIGQGSILKPWMDYGPTGVLGFMWKQRRDDLSTPPPPSMHQAIGQSWGPAFDVYAALSCDGGKTWLSPVRVNAESSPSGPNGFDDLSYVALDAHNAHLVWGDRRNISKVTNAPTGIGGLQVYYSRVAFSAVSNGAQCGQS